MPTTVYMDGVWDLFHVGHLHAIRQCAKFGDRVVIGVVGDIDGAAYKRRPVIAEADRCAIVSAIRGVDRVVCPCPLVLTDAFLDVHGIDCVVHSFSNADDAARQSRFFEAAIRRNAFHTVDYYDGTSTTDILAAAAAAAEAANKQPAVAVKNDD